MIFSNNKSTQELTLIDLIPVYHFGFDFFWKLSDSQMSQNEEVEEEEEEYKVQANLLKDEGNAAFQAGEIDKAIKLFSDAIAIDPDNAVYYSNRSAAYMKVDSISKALRDAEKCVELDPSWAKGYNRLGVAQQSLKRFDAALDTFKKGISEISIILFN